MAVLEGVNDAEFAMLRETAAISDSVLSKHLSALCEAGFVTLKKGVASGRQRTWIAITRAGRIAFKAHIAALHAITAMAGKLHIDG